VCRVACDAAFFFATGRNARRTPLCAVLNLRIPTHEGHLLITDKPNVEPSAALAHRACHAVLALFPADTAGRSSYRAADDPASPRFSLSRATDSSVSYFRACAFISGPFCFSADSRLAGKTLPCSGDISNGMAPG